MAAIVGNGLRVTLILVLVVVLALVAIVFIASTMMERQGDREAEKLLQSANLSDDDVIHSSDLQGLPSCVQQWLQKSGVVGKEKIHTIRLKQQGRMRMEEGKPWMPIEAVQYINVDHPGFVWKARVKAAPLTYLLGKDKYDQGHGYMQIKLFGLIPVVNANPGKEMDQGAMMRFLAEMIWYPSAAINDYITWEELDAYTARATMTWQGTTAAMNFKFNDKGDLVSNFGPRYRETNGTFELTDWGGVARSYKEFGGIRVQEKSDIIWKLEAGDFNWLQIQVTDMEFNKRELY